MRSIVIFALAGILSSFSARAENIEAQGAALPETKTLTIGSELDYPPFAIVNDKGEADGFSVDLFKATARVMELDIQFRTGPWDEVRGALERGEIDALPLVSYSLEREKRFDFTTPHTVSYAAVFVRKGESGIDAADDLRGKKIIAMRSDATHDYLVKNQVTSHLTLVKTVPEALHLLARGQGEYALVPRLVGLLTAKELTLNNLEITGPNIAVYGRGYGFAVREGNSALLAHLNQGLSIVKASGKYDEIYDKWFGVVDPRGVSLETIRQYAFIALSVFLTILGVALLWSWSLKREIKQRKQAEESLIKAKEAAETANQAKSVFLTNMSHELRTPLHAILGFSQWMNRDPLATLEQQECLEIINRSGGHLLFMINEVLEISKIEAGHINMNEEAIDLHRTLKDIADMMRIRAENKELHFLLEHSPELVHFIKTDAGKLRQTLLNLIGNAIKYTVQGGVRLRVQSRKHETVPDSKCRLFFEIEDSGIGIAEKNLDIIFDAFAQASPHPLNSEGTGLGLPITRHYVLLMGGDIEVKSQAGTGSLFKFHICAALADAAEIETSPPRVLRLAPGQAIPRILIVDDIRESRLLLRKLLIETGFSVREAGNGQEALQAVEAWHPHLIWMDMRMPVMDGYEAAKQIKSAPDGKKTVVIALAASAFEQQKKAALAAGCDDFVRKPFREDEIFKCMAKHLNIQYLYEKIHSEPMRSQTKTALEQSSIPSALAALPGDLLDELGQALKELDVDAVASAIQHIGGQDTALAKALMPYADDFQYEQLAHFLESKKESI
ncbi:MAG: transporter substrate-binding domain-containing protein [Gammaproteobacteria bacterium]|nr:transporter substrate-binding domain-containing protein [Gammaproteobacteria bacterium]